MTAFDRRTFLKLLAASGVAASSTLMSDVARAATGPLTVGILYSGSRQDYGYNESHALAAAELKKVPGIKVVEEERVPETIAAQRTMEGMIVQDGARLIIATSFGYFKPHVLEMARKYPDVTFAHTGGVWAPGMPDNAGTFYGYIFAAQYLAGVTAGHMTKSKKLGVVAAKPTPNLIRSIDAFTLGARSVDPGIKVRVIFTGDWVLPVREAESANSLADQGVDVIACNVDSPKVVVETAEKRGVMSIGYHSSQADVAPKGFLTGAEWNWIVPYMEYVKGVQAGQKPVHYLRGGLAEKFVRNTAFGSAVPQKVRDAVARMHAELVSGSRVIYSGPLSDNKGNVVIPAGTVYRDSDRALDAIHYLVDGVIGEV
ncbi:BMP family ABC transporter substrate-binding protein [Paraburkholderia hospita]|nr:BMP family ABC transporter substrate-binding protein [Paraburkholderia hospita]